MQKKYDRYNFGTAVHFELLGMHLSGVVVHRIDGGMYVVPVEPIEDGIHCCDDHGALETEQDYVRLLDCPDPFREQCEETRYHACFAMSSKHDLYCFTVKEFEEAYKGHEDLSGEPLTDRDMSEILNHFWRDEKQKYIPVDWEQLPESASLAADIMRERNEEASKQQSQKQAPLKTVAGSDIDGAMGRMQALMKAQGISIASKRSKEQGGPSFP